MRIIIALKGYFTAGDIFFETPDESELNRITEEIITICTDRLHKIYGDNKLAAKRLEEESIRMRAMCSGIQFAIIKEIVDLSGELGFPIRVMGEPEGSFISFLLGITNINPLPSHYSCDCGYFEQNDEVQCGIDLPDKRCPICGIALKKDGFGLYPNNTWDTLGTAGFGVLTAKAVSDRIGQRLNEKFSDVNSDSSLYRKISMPTADNDVLPKDLPAISDFIALPAEERQIIYRRAAEEILVHADDFSRELNGKFRDFSALIAEIKATSEITFYDVVRVYGYTVSGAREMSLSNILSPTFFTCRDDLYQKLISCSVPEKLAAEFAKRGIWNKGEKRKRYEEKLKAYDDMKEIINSTECISNLWTKAACVNRVILICQKVFKNKSLQ